MLTPGPRTTLTPSARASRPMAAATAATSSGSQLLANADAVGKHVAGTLFVRVLLAQPVRAVGQDNRGKAELRNAVHLPVVLA